MALEKISSPALDRAQRDLRAAQERFALREVNQKSNAQREVQDKLRNFDLYVSSVMEAKALKVIQAKTERKKNRLRDEMVHTEAHYKEQREQIIKRAEAKSYKKPLYLIAAEERVKALTPVDGRNSNPSSFLDAWSGDGHQERSGAEPESVLAS